MCGSVTELSEGTTLDEQVQLADLIALKYLNKGEEISGKAVCSPDPTMRLMCSQLLVLCNDDKQRFVLAGGATVWSAGDHTLTHMSMATQQYLQRHQLMDNGKGGGNVLDIGRLKTLPKLL